MFEGAQDGDFAERGDGDAVLALRGRDADLLEGDDALRGEGARAVDDAIGWLVAVSEWTAEKGIWDVEMLGIGVLGRVKWGAYFLLLID